MRQSKILWLTCFLAMACSSPKDGSGDCKVCSNVSAGGIATEGSSCGSVQDCACGLDCVNQVCTPFEGDFTDCKCQANACDNDSPETTESDGDLGGVTGDADDADGVDGEVGDCEALADGAECDDGDSCTEGDECKSGNCVGGASKVCDSEGQCRTGSCDPEEGCVYEDVENETPCLVACFSVSSCIDGECQPDADTAIKCPEAVDSCVAKLQCDPSTGECTVPIYEAENTACNSDENLCTLEVCSAEGECTDTGDLEACASQQAGNPCWTYSCNQKSGCTANAFVENNSCNDGNPCTVNDICTYIDLQKEACLGQPVDVDDGNPCTDDKCVDGVITHTQIDGLACNPNDDCSEKGICKAGKCIALSSCE